MPVVTSLFIRNVEPKYTAEDIIDLFYTSDIATVSRVTLVPSGGFNKAYVDILEWHPTEGAYNFIQRINDPTREARFIHSDDEWWVVEANKKPFITTSKKMAKFTTVNYLAIDKSQPETLPWILCGDSFNEKNEWNELERELSEMLAYQNLEYELCL